MLNHNIIMINWFYMGNRDIIDIINVIVENNILHISSTFPDNLLTILYALSHPSDVAQGNYSNAQLSNDS